MNNRRYGSRILAQGISVCNDTVITGLNNNDIIVGKSGCGKTGGYVIPNIQNIDSSMVVSDTKGQLARKFSRELRAMGYEVQVLDLVNPDRSCGYNPLQFIRRYPNGSYREQDIMTLAKTLCPVMDSNEPIWELSAANYLAFLIGYCLMTAAENKKNMIHVAELHRSFNRNSRPFLAWIESHPNTFPDKKYTEIMANKSADKMWASIMGFVNVALAPFDFGEAEYIFGRENNFDLRRLGRKKTVLFLNVSDTDSTFDVINNILYTQLFQTLCYDADQNPDGRLNVPVRIILDDFAASAKITDFDKVISVIRSRDIYVSIVLQSLSQLQTMYGEATSKTILNNCDHILFLGSQDIETAQYIASRANKTPEVILEMPRGKAYLISAGEKAKLVDKVVPYSTVSSLNPDPGIEEEGLIPFN